MTTTLQPHLQHPITSYYSAIIILFNILSKKLLICSTLSITLPDIDELHFSDVEEEHLRPLWKTVILDIQRNLL